MKKPWKLVKKYYIRHDPVGLCNELISKSTEIWKVEDEVINDITEKISIS